MALTQASHVLFTNKMVNDPDICHLGAAWKGGGVIEDEQTERKREAAVQWHLLLPPKPQQTTARSEESECWSHDTFPNTF